MKIPKYIKPRLVRNDSGFWSIAWLDYPLSEGPLPESAMIEHETMVYPEPIQAWNAFKDWIR